MISSAIEDVRRSILAAAACHGSILDHRPLASTRLLVNASRLDASTISPVVSVNQFCRTTIASLRSGSTVPLQLFGITSVVKLLAPGGAGMNVEQLD